MSWSLRIEGTADELRSDVHLHETAYWRQMPVTERLGVHHLVGHAIEEAEEFTQAGHTGQRFSLNGWGHQYGGNFDAHLTLMPLPDPPADPPSA